MVGELDVASAGQTATIEFLRDRILLHFADYASARAISGCILPSPAAIGRLLSFGDIGLMAQIGNRKSVQLFPQPSWIVRLLSPAIREMARAARNSAS
jgi:hypothetical protein